MNTLETVEISGKEYQLPIDTNTLKKAIEYANISDRAVNIIKSSLFLGIFYLLFSLLGFNLILFFFGLYFLLFFIFNKDKKSPKILLAYGITILIIAASNIFISLVFKHTTNFVVFWLLFSAFQVQYAVKLILIHKKLINNDFKDIDRNNDLKNLVFSVRKSKSKPDNQIFEFRKGAYALQYKILITKYNVIMINGMLRLAVVNAKDFSISKKKKVLFEKKYKVKIAFGNKILHGIMRIADYDKYISLKA